MIDNDPLDRKYRRGWRKYYNHLLHIKNRIIWIVRDFIQIVQGKPTIVEELYQYQEKIQQRENKKHKKVPIGTHKGLTYCPICIRGELW